MLWHWLMHTGESACLAFTCFCRNKLTCFRQIQIMLKYVALKYFDVLWFEVFANISGQICVFLGLSRLIWACVGTWCVSQHFGADASEKKKEGECEVAQGRLSLEIYFLGVSRMLEGCVYVCVCVPGLHIYPNIHTLHTLLRIKVPKECFHSYSIEEPFLVPKWTFQWTVLKRTIFFLVWKIFLKSKEPFSTIKTFVEWKFSMDVKGS